MELKIGVVVPAYKERESIAQLVTEIRAHVASVEIVVVDDSPDMSTVEALASLPQAGLRVIHRTSKGGRGTAVIEGLTYLRDLKVDYAVEMDADFSHAPSQIPQLIEYSIAQRTDLLIASRYIPGSRIENWPVSRRVLSYVSNLVARAALRVPVSDYTNGFRVYSTRAIDVIIGHCGHLGKGFVNLSEILVNVYYRDLRVAQVPTVFINRLRGESSMSFQEFSSAVVGVYKIRLLKNQLMKASSLRK